MLLLRVWVLRCIRRKVVFKVIVSIKIMLPILPINKIENKYRQQTLSIRILKLIITLMPIPIIAHIQKIMILN